MYGQRMLLLVLAFSLNSLGLCMHPLVMLGKQAAWQVRGMEARM